MKARRRWIFRYASTPGTSPFFQKKCFLSFQFFFLQDGRAQNLELSAVLGLYILKSYNCRHLLWSTSSKPRTVGIFRAPGLWGPLALGQRPNPNLMRLGGAPGPFGLGWFRRFSVPLGPWPWPCWTLGLPGPRGPGPISVLAWAQPKAQERLRDRGTRDQPTNQPTS